MSKYQDVTTATDARGARQSEPASIESETSDWRTVAAVDLGSNSFHMVVARAEAGQLHVIDRIKETVRLAAGLDAQRHLSDDAIQRALNCLERFGQRLARLPSVQVRAVGTNTLRRARPLGPFLECAEKALGHPIDVIYGVEEARLIYAGVALDLGADRPRRLVADIGGGSTELVIGHTASPELLESLELGAVTHSERFFARGKITKSRWRDAVVDARLKLEPIELGYRAAGWDIALGASGSIKAIQRVCAAAGWSQEAITRDALAQLAKRLIDAGQLKKAKLASLDDDRRPIFAGAVTVLTAIFDALELDAMRVTDKALREGILSELAGKSGASDLRETSIVETQRRYSVDTDHADRVATTAGRLLTQSGAWVPDAGTEPARLLRRACQLHEIGLAIAHKGYQKHGAYIIDNADLHGFSRSEQSLIAALIRLQRGKFRPTALDRIPSRQQDLVSRLAVLMRLAVLLHRGRDPTRQMALSLSAKDRRVALDFDAGWLDAHPLAGADLARERDALASADYTLKF